MIEPIRYRSLVATLAVALGMTALMADAWAAPAGGKVLFDRECAVCHGTTGEGDGPVAELCDPAPRNFADGLYKLRTTESGELPTDADLTKSVTDGIPGTAMPSFRHLGADAISDVIAYLKTLGGPENEEGSWFDLYEVPPPISIPPAPSETADTRALGARLYVDMGCDGCHGASGAGDGKTPEEMLDDSGDPLHARNFRLGVYKGGARPEDLYARIMTGMDGTPMTGFWKDAMTPVERWALVGHVLTYGKARPVEQPSNGTVQVTAGPAPASVDDAAWKAAAPSDVLRMPLSGGWLRYFTPLEVRAVAEENKLALSVSWDDGDLGCQVLQAVFPAVAGPISTVHLGSPAAPVRVWRWQEESGAQALDRRGPGSGEPVDTDLEATAQRTGSRQTVALVGARPPHASRLLLTVSSCGEGKGHVTASTFYDLRAAGGAASARNEP